jgi:hypothetical protein
MRSLRELLLSSYLLRWTSPPLPAKSGLASPQNNSSRHAPFTLLTSFPGAKSGELALPRRNSSRPRPIHLARIDSFPISSRFRPRTSAHSRRRSPPDRDRDKGNTYGKKPRIASRGEGVYKSGLSWVGGNK